MKPLKHLFALIRIGWTWLSRGKRKSAKSSNGTEGQNKRKLRRLTEDSPKNIKTKIQPAVGNKKLSPYPSLLRKWWQLSKKTYGIGFGLLTLIVLVYEFAPDISVEPYKALDPQNPFTEQFTVHNNNAIYSLYDLRYGCFLLDQVINVAGLRIEMRNLMFSLTRLANELAPKDSATIICTANAPNVVERADMLIDVQFKVRWWPKYQTIRHRFAGRKTSSNAVEWFHVASPPFSEIPSILEMPRPPLSQPDWLEQKK